MQSNHVEKHNEEEQWVGLAEFSSFSNAHVLKFKTHTAKFIKAKPLTVSLTEIVENLPENGTVQ
jgi:hypothetical protein